MQIADGIYMMANRIDCPLRTINTYLLRDGQDAYLVDTGWPDHLSRSVMGVAPQEDGWDKLLELMREADVKVEQLTGILLTHSHMDHAAYVPRLQELCAAPVLLLDKELEENHQMSRRDAGRYQIMMHWFGRNGVPSEIAERMIRKSIVQPPVPEQNMQLLHDGQMIRVGRMQWEVIWTPGHTLGHICLLERERGIMITGDHLLPHETPIIMTTPIMYDLHPNPLGSYDWSLHRMQGLPVQLGLPGHGRTMPDFQEIVLRQLSHHDTRYDDALASLYAHDDEDAFTICCAIPWAGRHLCFTQLRTTDQLFAFSETIAHLRALEGQGLVHCYTLPDGQVRWRLTAAGQDKHLAFLKAQG